MISATFTLFISRLSLLIQHKAEDHRVLNFATKDSCLGRVGCLYMESDLDLLGDAASQILHFNVKFVDLCIHYRNFIMVYQLLPCRV
jgi:hypothetical protein